MQAEKRFNYEPFKKVFIDCKGSSHAIALHNKKEQKNFDNYIRGIIDNNILYLRLYYPFEDIQELSLAQLKRKSTALLSEFKAVIKSKVSDHYGIKINKIVLNVDNVYLKELKLANI